MSDATTGVAAVAVALAAVARLESKTLPFPPGFPMQDRYNLDHFYVRDCYSTYYMRVLHLLRKESNEGVTITGTPDLFCLRKGIDKSLFMVYFFQRYRIENPETTIMTASYTSVSACDAVVVVAWKDGIADTLKHTDYDSVNIYAEHHVPVLHLLDGPPRIRPRFGNWVCFTSPNEMWYNQHRKKSYHTQLFMPIWTLDELRDAANALGLDQLLGPVVHPVDALGAAHDMRQDVTMEKENASDGSPDLSASGLEETIEEDHVVSECLELLAQQSETDVIGARWQIFGGIARACLEVKTSVVADLYQNLKVAANKMDALVVRSVLQRDYVADDAYHLVFHLHPTKSCRYHKSDVASKHVERLLLDRLATLTNQERKDFEHVLFTVPEASQLVEWVVDMRVYMTLNRD